jgi:hypothetical protein
VKKITIDLEFIKPFFLNNLTNPLKLDMFTLGDLEIKVLKALSEKPVSTIWLYDSLTKKGITKLAFENAIKTLEKKKLVYSESLSLRLTENGRKMLTILEAH